MPKTQLRKRTGEGRFARMHPYLNTAWNAGTAAYQAYQRGKAVTTLFRGKKGGSKTKTTRRKGIGRHRSDSNHGNVYNKFVVWNKPPRTSALLKKIGTRATHDDTGTFFLQTGDYIGTTNKLNKQDVGQILALWQAASIQTLSDHAYNANAVWQTIRPGANSAQRTGKIFLESCKTDFEFVNMGPTVASVTIYTLRCKKSTGLAAPDSAARWETAVDVIAGAQGTSAVSANVPNVTPNNLRDFRVWWTPVKSKTWQMNPGETVKYRTVIGLNKYCDYSQTMNTDYIANYSYAFLMVGKGSPCDTSQDTTTTPTIQLSPIKIIGVAYTHYVTKWIPISPDVGWQNNAISGAIPASLYTMNDDSGLQTDLKTVKFG